MVQVSTYTDRPLSVADCQTENMQCILANFAHLTPVYISANQVLDESIPPNFKS